MAQELLKEAIADAKAVREVALQNAKMALEEAFDSKIKNMLSAKLAEELEEDVELEEDYIEEEAEATDEGMSYEKDDKDAQKEEVDLEEDLDEEINLDELMAELEEMSDTYEEDGINEGEDVELEEAVLSESHMRILEFMEEADILNKAVSDPVALQILAGTIASVAGLYGYEATKDKLRDAVKDLANKGVDLAKKLLGRQDVLKKLDTLDAAADENENVQSESFDIDALISEIEAELEEGKANDEEVKEVKKKDNEKMEKMEEELEEALLTVAALRESISEMNLLNSKLLYCNKLFRANALTEAQKVKVVDALDKATTTGEAKLVFETLEESFAFTGVEKKAIQEGLGRASKPAGVAPKNVITESVDETVSRFQKLANIKF